MPKQNNEIEIIELTEENIRSMVYEIRGQKVMLDFDLARIYGYSTNAFNQQVKRNIEKFPKDFMFQITKEETKDILRSQIVTANELSSKRRYNPYAFTEQGIYMLMTVLKGDLATRQSIALIQVFKQMKDCINTNHGLINIDSALINNKFSSYDKRFETMENKLDVVMENFVDPSTYKHVLILVGEKIEAEIAYKTIYSLAKKSIYIVDDYINIQTLMFLRNVNHDIEIIIFSDNVARDHLTNTELDNFNKEYGLSVKVFKNNNIFHDRYIVIDYLEQNEKIYHSGASSKDAGNKICTIDIIEKKESYRPFINQLLSNNR